MKKMPKHYNELKALAKALGLSNPHGRALYGCNRIQNGGWYFRRGTEVMEDTDGPRLARILPSTAKRWAENWKENGNIKSLRPRTEENRIRRERAAELRTLRTASANFLPLKNSI